MLLYRIIRQLLELTRRSTEAIIPRRIAPYFGKDGGGEGILLGIGQPGHRAKGFFEEFRHAWSIVEGSAACY